MGTFNVVPPDDTKPPASAARDIKARDAHPMLHSVTVSSLQKVRAHTAIEQFELDAAALHNEKSNEDRQGHRRRLNRPVHLCICRRCSCAINRLRYISWIRQSDMSREARGGARVSGQIRKRWNWSLVKRLISRYMSEPIAPPGKHLDILLRGALIYRA